MNSCYCTVPSKLMMVTCNVLWANYTFIRRL